VCIALIATYTFLELVSGKVFHELRENGLTNVHSSLSRARRPMMIGTEQYPAKPENIQIEKSELAPKPLTQRDLLALEKV